MAPKNRRNKARGRKKFIQRLLIEKSQNLENGSLPGILPSPGKPLFSQFLEIEYGLY